MGSINLVVVSGFLGKDPEAKQAADGKTRAILSLGVSRNNGKDTDNIDWVDLVAFEKNGEFALQYLKKGSQLIVEGKLRTNTYEDGGKTRKTTNIVVSNFTSIGSKPSEDKGSYKQPEEAKKASKVVETPEPSEIDYF